MSEKERISKAPFLVFSRAQRHYLKSDLSKKILIEIEIKDQKKDLGLSSQGIYIGQPSNIIHQYDKVGTYYFMDMIPSFGKVEVILLNDEARQYENYEEFIDVITSNI